MREPQSLEEYGQRFNANQRVTGMGPDVTMHAPCPFCAAPSFLAWKVVETEEVLAGRSATCRECGRTARYDATTSPNRLVQLELVQVAGPPPPSWMDPPPRRVTG
jgi:hypothetical protein